MNPAHYLAIAQITAGASIKSVAERVGTSPDVIREVLSRLDGELPVERSQRVMRGENESIRDQTIAAQLNAGASYTAVARFHKLSRQTIHHIALKMQVETPDGRDARILRIPQPRQYAELTEDYVSLVR